MNIENEDDCLKRLMEETESGISLSLSQAKDF
jgi:hypothetical protein